MNHESFKRRHELPLAGLRSLITECVRKTGDKSEDCQQTYLLNCLNQLEHVFIGTEESDLIPHAIFREPIACVEDAQRLFRYLNDHGLLFHPEDDPADCLHGKISEDEARELRHRMREAWDQEWSEYDDPCGFCLTLTERGL